MDIIKDSKLFELTKNFIFKLFPLIEPNKKEQFLNLYNYNKYPELTFSKNVKFSSSIIDLNL